MTQLELNREKLKQERKSRKITQEQLAEDIGGSVRNIRYMAVFNIFCKRANRDNQMISGARGRAFG